MERLPHVVHRAQTFITLMTIQIPSHTVIDNVAVVDSVFRPIVGADKWGASRSSDELTDILNDAWRNVIDNLGALLTQKSVM